MRPGRIGNASIYPDNGRRFVAATERLNAEVDRVAAFARRLLAAHAE